MFFDGVDDIPLSIATPELEYLFSEIAPHSDSMFCAPRINNSNAFVPIEQYDSSPCSSARSSPVDDSSHDEDEREVRRRIVKKSEKKRRDKIKDRFEEIKSMLPAELKAPGPKLRNFTKEMVLSQTILYMKQLQDEVKSLKRHSVEEEGERKKRIKTSSSSSVDPCNQSSLSQEELKMGFNALLTQNMQSVYKGDPRSFLSTTMALDSLANKIEQKEYALFSLYVQSIYYSTISVEPEKNLAVLKKAIPLYFTIQNQKQSIQPIVISGADLGCMFLAHYAIALAAAGYYDQSTQQMEEAIKWEKRLNHLPTRQSFSVMLWIYKYWLGDSMSASDVKKVKDDCANSMVFSPTFDFVNGIAMTEQENPTSQLAGIDLMENALEMNKRMWGPYADINASLLRAYFVTGQHDAGIIKADCLLQQMEETAFFGSQGSAEVLRWKAEFLRAKFEIEKQAFIFPEQVQQIEDLYRLAMKRADEKGLTTVQLRCAIGFVKLHLSTGDVAKLREGKQSLTDLNNFLAPLSQVKQTSEILEALQLLLELQKL